MCCSVLQRVILILDTQHKKISIPNKKEFWKQFLELQHYSVIALNVALVSVTWVMGRQIKS